ncbi:MAG: hypothetical protein ACTHNS_01095 [Marmoricola sp.]
MAGTEGRATPFHCPYCADEDIRPYEGTDGGHGAWECRSCLRAFRVSLITHLARPTVTPAPGAPR